jgi:hypothetical protein
MTSPIGTLATQQGPDAIGVFDAGDSQRSATTWLTVGRPTTPVGRDYVADRGGGSYKSVTCLLNG